MLVRMKRTNLYSEDLSKLEVEINGFAETYKSDFEKYVAAGRIMHDPFPSVIVIKGYGLVAAATSKERPTYLGMKPYIPSGLHQQQLPSLRTSLSQMRSVLTWSIGPFRRQNSEGKRRGRWRDM